jgi:hypothetical protein
MNCVIPATPELLNLGNDYDANIQRTAQIKSVYLQGKVSKENKKKVQDPEVGKTETMRERILKVSLFPTIYK